MRLLPTATAPAALLASLALAACGGDDDNGDSGSQPDSGGSEVTVKTFNFQPDPIEVEAGTEISWTNEDETVHTVTAGTREKPDTGRFDEQLAASGGTASVSFDEPGTYDYFCTIHSGPGMTAQVVIK